MAPIQFGLRAIFVATRIRPCSTNHPTGGIGQRAFAGGGGGTFAPGRFVKHGAKPACNLFLSMADRMGVKNLERFGDSTARLANI